MNKLVALISMVAGMSLISGCVVDTSTPEGTIHAAMSALDKNDVEMFKSLLDGDALDQWGNAEGMAKIREAMKDWNRYLFESQEIESDRACPNCRESYQVHKATATGLFTVPPEGPVPHDGASQIEMLMYCKVNYFARSPRSTVRCKITVAELNYNFN